MIEVLGFISIGMIGFGCFLMYPPLGFLIPGIIFLAITCLAGRNRVPNKKG